MTSPFTPSADAASLHLRAIRCAEAGDFPQAVRLLETALISVASPPDWFGDLGIAREAAGDRPGALSAFTEFVHLSPSSVRAHIGRGELLLRFDRAEDARRHFSQALLLHPFHPRASAGLARALALLKDLDGALDILQCSLRHGGEHAATHRTLASILAAHGQNEPARTHWQRLLALAPGDPEALAGLVQACWALGDVEATLAHAQTIVECGKAPADLHSFYVYSLLYHPASTAESLKQAVLRFGRSLAPAAQPDMQAPQPRRSGRGRKLRIGYLSGEFLRGPALFFIGPLLRNHDRGRFEIFLYHTRPVFDSATQWYSTLAHWRDCRTSTDTSIMAAVRQDRIDILVDLSGFYPAHRLSVFARRAAPVQMSYPNCPLTTGVPRIDYLITDRWTCPPGSEHQYSETPLFLPSGYLAYEPPSDAPAISDAPFERNGFITFGLFQRGAKINGEVLDRIAQVIRCVPGSRFLIHHNDPDLDQPDSRSRSRFVRDFEARGVSASRLLFRGALPHRESLRTMAAADIALDTFPYQGQTTTCECLWMGVPVIALAGRHHVARVGSALLERAGLPELSAGSLPGYVALAVGLAASPERIRRYRGTLRQRLAASPVCDGKSLALQVEHAFRAAWRSYRQTKESTTR